MNRRNFIKSMAAMGAMPLLPGCFSSKGYVANGKVRLAAIGVGCQAWFDIQQLTKNKDLCELVAICDTDMGAKHTLDCLKAFPAIPRFQDFRKMFDWMADKIDAVLVATPDHSHFAACLHAMRLGKHVYVEKPLANTFRECEILMQAEKKYGVVCQMGNQGHSGANYWQFRDYWEKGLVKDVTKVVSHMNNERRWHKWGGKVDSLPKAQPIPKTLDWGGWLSVQPHHDYNADYMVGEWRNWFDFGDGCMGDWGAHLIDCVHEFLLKGDLPSVVKVVKQSDCNRFVYPMNSTLQFLFPANGDHDAFELDWYEGAANLPPLPEAFTYATPDGIPKSSANSDSESVSLFPGKEMYQKDGMIWQSLSHKHPLHVVGDYARKLPDYPAEFCTHYEGFLRAVRGEMETLSPFSVAAPLSQLFALACIAQRLGRGFAFDRKNGMILGDEEANALLRQAPRKGWEEYYKV